jgi:hypothetical protein
MMWGDRGEAWCYDLSKVWNVGEGYDHHGLWLVMLESAKDRVSRVDTLGQQVSSRVRYGMTCLLIKDAVESVPSSDEWEIGVVTRLSSHGARGAVVPRTTLENISIATVPCTTLANPGIWPIVNLCNGM